MEKGLETGSKILVNQIKRLHLRDASMQFFVFSLVVRGFPKVFAPSQKLNRARRRIQIRVVLKELPQAQEDRSRLSHPSRNGLTSV
jgi:hypothetical protein